MFFALVKPTTVDGMSDDWNQSASSSSLFSGGAVGEEEGKSSSGRASFTERAEANPGMTFFPFGLGEVLPCSACNAEVKPLTRFRLGDVGGLLVANGFP